MNSSEMNVVTKVVASSECSQMNGLKLIGLNSHRTYFHKQTKLCNDQREQNAIVTQYSGDALFLFDTRKSFNALDQPSVIFRCFPSM